MKEKAVQLDLFTECFSATSDKNGVACAMLNKVIEAKQKYNGKPLSASERARSEKLIRKIVKEATAGKKEMTTQQVIEAGRKINEARGLYAVFSDLENDHSVRLWPTEKNLMTWAKHPDKYDLIGVDNKKKFDATKGENKGKTFKLFGFIG